EPAKVKYSPWAKFAMRWMPKTREAPTPVSARMAPVMRPFTVSCASCRIITGRRSLPVRRRAIGPGRTPPRPVTPVADLGLERDRLDDGGRPIRLRLPDVVGRRAHAAVRREVDGAGGAMEVDLLALQHGLDGLIELLERVVRARPVRHGDDVLGELGGVRRLRLERRQEGHEDGVERLRD